MKQAGQSLTFNETIRITELILAVHRWCLFSSVSHVSDRLELHNNNWASGSQHPGSSESDVYSDVVQEAQSNDLLHTARLLMRLDMPLHDNNARGTKYAVYYVSVVMHRVFENKKWLHSRCFGIKKAQSLPLLLCSLAVILLTSRWESINSLIDRGVWDPLFSWFISSFLKIFLCQNFSFFFYFKPIFGILPLFHGVFPCFLHVASHTSVLSKCSSFNEIGFSWAEKKAPAGTCKQTNKQTKTKQKSGSNYELYVQ